MEKICERLIYQPFYSGEHNYFYTDNVSYGIGKGSAYGNGNGSGDDLIYDAIDDEIDDIRGEWEDFCLLWD